jgi:hypothetical protein
VISAINALWQTARTTGASGPALSLVAVLSTAVLGLTWLWGYSVGHTGVAAREETAIATERASVAMDNTQLVRQAHDAALSASSPGGASEQLPGGACGAAGDAGAAGAAGAAAEGCEQPSAVTVGQFQDVAQVNAALHGECITRLQRLVDFLNGR